MTDTACFAQFVQHVLRHDDRMFFRFCPIQSNKANDLRLKNFICLFTWRVKEIKFIDDTLSFKGFTPTGVHTESTA